MSARSAPASAATLRALHQSLAPLAIDKPLVATPVCDPKAVRPVRQAEIEYRALPAMGCCGTRRAS